MRARNLMQLIVLICFPAACTVVYSPSPIGISPAVLDAAEWDGSWIHSAGYLTITVLDAESGRIRAGWIEGDKVEKYSGEIRTAGDWMFGNVRDGSERNLWLWGRIKKETREIILWVPSVETFKKLIESGQIPGTVDDDGNIILAEMTPDHLQAVMSCTAGPAMEWEHPIVLLRDPDPPVLPKGLYKVYGIDTINAGKEKMPAMPRIVSYDQSKISGRPGIPVRCLVVNAVPDVPFILKEPPKKDIDPDKKTARLQIQLNTDAAGALEAFTRENLNGTAAVIVGGQVISIHKIRTPITGGKMQITRCSDDACEVIYSQLVD